MLTEISGWSDVDWKSVTSSPSIDSKGPPFDDQVQLAVTKPASIDLKPTPFPFFSTYRPKELVNDNISFVPAISIFDDFVGSGSDGRRCGASARFATKPGMCLANNIYGRRCGSRDGIPIAYQPTVRKLLAELQGLDPELNKIDCIHKLAAFTNLAVCPFQRIVIRNQVEDLRKRWGVEQPEYNQRTAISDKVASLQNMLDFERPEDKTFIKYLPLFLPYRPSESTHQTIDQIVVKQAEKSFDPDPLDEGYLYVYWNRATFDIRKIGFTTGDVSGRLGGWEKNCNHVAREQYRSACKVEHAGRVEALVHADLSDYRVFEPACHTCLQSHIEWFRGVNLAFIIERIEAWSQWMSTKPYEKNGSQWKLTNEGRSSLTTMMLSSSCRGPEISTIRPANRPQRYNLRNTKARKSDSKLKPPEITDINRKDYIAD